MLVRDLFPSYGGMRRGAFGIIITGDLKEVVLVSRIGTNYENLIIRL